MEDCEADISCYTIRKTVANQPAQQTWRSYYVEPLLIKDLLLADGSKEVCYNLFNGTLQFKRCIIYGRIVAVNKAQICQIYKLDDGTGCINVVLYKMDKENEQLRCMKQKVDMVDNQQVREALHRLLQVSEKLLDIFSLQLGTRVVVLGRPTKFHGELCLKTENLFVDDGIDRSLEIAFKDNLIERYLKRQTANS